MDLLYRTSSPGQSGKTPIFAAWRRLALAALGAVMLVLLSATQTQQTATAGRAESGLFAFGTRSGIALTSPHSTGTNPLIHWADLEPHKGSYDWTLLDKAISAAGKAGKQVAPRIYTNVSGYGMASPSWFFKQPGARHYYPSSSARSKGLKAPVSWDPVFQEHFGRFLDALARRYDGNPAIAFIQTNAGGGIFGEMLLATSDNYYPSDWTVSKQADAMRFWVDRWTDAFRSTRTAFMFNSIGQKLAENAVPYAAGRGMYIQTNSHRLSKYAVNSFSEVAEQTRIILEVEDSGGQSATRHAFEKMIDTVFSYGFPIDYLMLHQKSFGDSHTAARLPGVIERLRGYGAVSPATPPVPPVAEATGAEAPAPPAAKTTSGEPGIYSPARGSTWSGSRVTFEWNPTPGAVTYWIAITNADGASVVNQRAGGSGSTSITLDGLPADGKKHYVQLSAQVNGKWTRYNYSYSAASGGTPSGSHKSASSAAPGIYSPVSGSTWAGSSVTFKWNPTPGATMYWIAITSSNGVSVVNKSAGGAGATSISISGLPRDGKTYYVQLSANVDGKWVRYNYAYKAK